MLNTKVKGCFVWPIRLRGVGGKPAQSCPFTDLLILKFQLLPAIQLAYIAN